MKRFMRFLVESNVVRLPVRSRVDSPSSTSGTGKVISINDVLDHRNEVKRAQDMARGIIPKKTTGDVGSNPHRDWHDGTMHLDYDTEPGNENPSAKAKVHRWFITNHTGSHDRTYVSGNDAYSHFSKWQQRLGHSPVGEPTFHREMTLLGVPHDHSAEDGHSYFNFKLKE